MVRLMNLFVNLATDVSRLSGDPVRTVPVVSAIVTVMMVGEHDNPSAVPVMIRTTGRTYVTRVYARHVPCPMGTIMVMIVVADGDTA